MKKTLFLVIAALSTVAHTSFSQHLVAQVKVVDQWGYVDSKGTLVVPAKYNRSSPFGKDGIAEVYDLKTKTTLFIKSDGQPVTLQPEGIEPKEITNYASKGFNDGLLGFQHKKKWGFLNTEGKVVIPATYDKVTEFDNGTATAQTGLNFFVLNTKGEATPVKIEGLADLNDFSEKLAPYKTKDRKVGFIDPMGNIAIAAQFQSVGDFSGGLAWAKTMEGLVGYINTKGQWAIEPQFKAVKDFDGESGKARVRKEETWGFSDKTGNIMFIKESDHFGDFSNGLAWVKLASGKVGFVNTKGEWAIPATFDDVRDFKNGYAAAEMNKKWGFIDKTGKWIIEPQYDAAKDMEATK